MRILMGTSKLSITPTESIFLAGYADRAEPLEGVRSNLFVRCFCLKQGDTIKYIVQGDLIWWGGDFIADMRNTLYKIYGIREGDVLFTATHTHGGPQTSRLFVPSLGIYDEKYNLFLKEQTLQAVTLSADNMEEVTIKVGRGQSFLGVNRRKLEDGIVKMQPNREGSIDNTVDAAVFESAVGGLIKGAIIVYPCHANVSSENFVSSDYCGIAMDGLEKEYRDSVFIFMQGFTGNIRPDLSKEEKFIRGKSEDTQVFAEKFKGDVQNILHKPKRTLEPFLDSRLIGVPLDYKTPRVDYTQKLKEHEQEQGVKGEWSRFILSHKERLDKARLELMCFNLSKDYFLLAANGEMVIEYALFAREHAQGTVICCGYCNGMIGYVATAEQLMEGGYEAEGFIYYFTLPEMFSHNIEHAIKKQMLTFLHQ